MRANSYNTGIASEYLILSKLYRLDLEAYISQGNKKSVDIRVLNKDEETLSIDVKSVRGYSSLVVNNMTPKESHFIVFVVYNSKFEDLEIDPDIFIVPSLEISELQSEFKGEQKRVMKGKLLEYKDNWDLILNYKRGTELKDEKVLNNYNKVIKLNKSHTRKEVLAIMNLTEDELTALEISYNEITGM